MALKRKLNLGFGTDPDNVNLSELPPQAKGQNGGVYEQNDKRWQMAQLVDAGPSVAGDLGYLKLSGTSTLYGQATRTIGNSLAGLACGVFTRAVTLNYYTLLRLGGVFDVKAEASYDGAGDRGFAHTANNSMAGVAAGVATTSNQIAVALAAISGGKTMSYLNIPYVG